jgi:predicted aconitase with swiveling domain
MALKADVLLEGQGQGEVLALTHPISFWGGVDPRTGLIIDARHPERGQSIAGKILAMPAMIGSSSAAAVMLELVHAGRAPAALIMPAPDAILLLGIIVAREMGWSVPPAYALSAADQRTLHGKQVTIGADGEIQTLD